MFGLIFDPRASASECQEGAWTWTQNAKKNVTHISSMADRTPGIYGTYTYFFGCFGFSVSLWTRARARSCTNTSERDMRHDFSWVWGLSNGCRFLFSSTILIWFLFIFLHTHISICCCNVNCFIDLFDLMRDFIITTHAPAILYSMYIVTILSNTERSNICRIVTGPTRQKFAGCVMLSDRRFLIDGFGCAAVNEVSNITE